MPEQQVAAQEPVKPPEQVPVPEPTVQEHIAQRKADMARERGEKGGVRQRIKALTKESADATAAAQAAAKAATDAAEAAKKMAESKPAPAAEQPKPFDKARPVFADYVATGKASATEDYYADLAAWNVEKLAAEGKIIPKIEPKPAVQAAPAEPAVDPELMKQATAVLDTFQSKAKQFQESHPDWTQTLVKAGERGLNLSNANQAVILQLDNGPEVAYWLAKPENEAKAREIMTLSPMKAGIELARLSVRLEVNPAQYVSGAPEPPVRLTSGATRNTLPLDSPDVPMRDYIRRRKAGES